MARSLNKVQLIGNLTRDPELRYTPNGNAVCSFSIATNRNWTTDSGEKREEVDFHRIIAWNKLGELCSQFLVKGRKVYVEGRLTTRAWTGQDGSQKSTTEVIINDMILLDKAGGATSEHQEEPREKKEEVEESHEPKEAKPVKKIPKSEQTEEEPRKVNNDEEVMPDDIPF
ncbi:MAG TPA: single-stranded DNA-binding protein [Candidatus Limnocylindrales bacterium]|nr:single-stranded DNA-binding protein [Candidatus Limnocylindrales bacterium]